MLKNHSLLQAVVWLLVSLSAFGAGAGSSEVTQEQLDALKKDIQTLTVWLNTANQQMSQLHQALAGIERDISATSLAIAELNQRQLQLATEQTRLKQQKQQAEIRVEAQRSQLVQVVLALYKAGDESLLQRFLDQDDPVFWRRMTTYSQTISARQLALIEDYRNNLNQIEQAEASLKDKAQEYKTATLQLALKQQDLQKQKTDRSQVYQRLNSDIQSSSAKLDAMKNERANLEALLAKMAEAIESLVPDVPVQDFASRKSQLEWPLAGKLLQSFGSKLGNGPLTSQGIVIGAKANTSVNAVHQGRVVFADWLNGYGLLLIIDHGDDYMSLYARNEVLMRSVGEWVNAGDLVAKSGDNGLGVAGLYFEIRHLGKPQNPVSWLRKSR